MSLKNLINSQQLRTSVQGAIYLFQLGPQVESLMERKLLEDLGESYKVHTHCRWLKKERKKEKKNSCCSNNLQRVKACFVQQARFER